MKILTVRVFVESSSYFLPKMVFLPFLAAILHFCVKHESTFISEMVRDRRNLKKFFDAQGFPKNHFPTIFGGHLEFLHKMRKSIILRNLAFLYKWKNIYF